MAARHEPGRLQRRRRLVGEDHEQPQVILAELVDTQLGQRDHTDHALVVSHRDHQHRFVDVVGSGDRRAARIGVGIVNEQGCGVLGRPAGEPVAKLCAQHVEVDLFVCADGPLEGDRDQVVRLHELVNPAVVIVDDAAHFLDDRPPDRLDRVLAAHPRRRSLQHAELASPGARAREERGVVERD